MSLELDRRLETTGARFLIFPQPRFLPSFAEPEVVAVSVPAGQVRPGPSDDRMYVLDAPNKTPYGRRPYQGSSHAPVPVGPGGHFTHLTDFESREFSCAVMYATVRRVLDIWEDYFQRRIDWHFRLSFDRLELIPLINWDNAQSGYGFLEFGYGRTPAGNIDPSRPYCQNFDVLAHELGHSFIYSIVGTPPLAFTTHEFGGFHESAGDLVAIVAMLHSPMAVDHLLAKSQGNLFSANELSRVGELSDSREIRSAFNYERMSTVSLEEHALSQPLTGAIFDVFVELYQNELVTAGLITQDLADRSFNAPPGGPSVDALQQEFADAYEDRHDEFRLALFSARDYLGRLLARTWTGLSPANLSYSDVALRLMEMDGRRNESTIRECFLWREITVPPHVMEMHTRNLTQCGLNDTHASRRGPMVRSAPILTYEEPKSTAAARVPRPRRVSAKSVGRARRVR